MLRSKGIGVLRFKRRNLSMSPMVDICQNPPVKPRYQNRASQLGMVVALGGALVMLFLWVGYEGYYYMESPRFCGQSCHTPMAPEYAAHLDSSHGSVQCVQCHEGESAGGHIQSKLQGVRHLWTVVFNTYDRPIVAPLMNLRSANEICRRCHSLAEKPFGNQFLRLPYFQYDEANSQGEISLRLNAGPDHRSPRARGGTHWHMMNNNDVTFAATDPKWQDIPWVTVRSLGGIETTYVSTTTSLRAEQLAKLPRKAMACIDCHNRVGHAYPPLDGGIDEALFMGKISPSLPWIKELLVQVMTQDHRTREVAHEAMRTAVVGTYQTTYPNLVEERRADIDQAIKVAGEIYDRTMFPDMHVNWRTYPVNIGHRDWPGCFRCHDGQHASLEGKVLGSDCSKTCHSEPQRSRQVTLGAVDPNATDDWHPWPMPSRIVDVPGHRYLLCSNCHEAGRGPKSSCGDCHGSQH